MQKPRARYCIKDDTELSNYVHKWIQKKFSFYLVGLMLRHPHYSLTIGADKTVKLPWITK